MPTVRYSTHVYFVCVYNILLSDRKEEVYSPAGAPGEGEEFIVVNSLGVPPSHRRSLSSGKEVTLPQNKLERRL